jgi:hypothetical protein
MGLIRNGSIPSDMLLEAACFALNPDLRDSGDIVRVAV